MCMLEGGTGTFVPWVMWNARVWKGGVMVNTDFHLEAEKVAYGDLFCLFCSEIAVRELSQYM